MFGGFELLLIPVIIWMYLKIRQGKMINNVVKMLESSGQIYFGQDGEGKPRIMVLVAANKNGEIVDAKLIRLLRWFKPANMFDLPEIIGKQIDDLVPAKTTRDIELRDALKNLKQNYSNLNNRKESKIKKSVKSKRVIKR